MKQNAIITLAWPEGMVAATGSWYDRFFSNNGKYRVGHSALVLIDYKKKKSHYFDFGRYHTPLGYGRVRDSETDPDVTIIDPIIKDGKLTNLKSILVCLSQMESTHGEGKMYASMIEGIDFERGYSFAKKIQNKGMVKYGPFIINGTNCSRFVAKVLINSVFSVIKKLRLRFPFCIFPSPKRNVNITNHNYFILDGFNCKEVSKSKLVSYFTSIENI